MIKWFKAGVSNSNSFEGHILAKKWAHGPRKDKNRSPRASIENRKYLNST